MILTETMNSINKRKDAAMNAQTSGKGMGMGMEGPPAIGEF